MPNRIDSAQAGILDSLDWAEVRRHYDSRVKVSKRMLEMHAQQSAHKFANLALGVSDSDGNYSAAEHGLGPKILGTNANAEQRVFDLASEFVSLTSAQQVPSIIKQAQVKYLQIGVGSEISALCRNLNNSSINGGFRGGDFSVRSAA